MRIDTSKFNNLSENLKAIAHPERLAILNLLCKATGHRLAVQEIYKLLNLSQPCTSRHLGVLKRSGILRRELIGIKTIYIVQNSKLVEAINKLLLATKND